VIDGREIVVVNNTENDLPRFVKVILLVCKTEPMAKHFPRITFEIKPDFSNPQINMLKLSAGEAVVDIGGDRINIMDIFKENRRPFEQQWFGIISHELAHLYHNYKSSTLVIFDKTKKRLLDSLERKNTLELDPLIYLRKMLFNFSRSIFTEGIATYYERLKLEEVLYSEKDFQRSYTTESFQVEYIIKQILMCLEGLTKKNSNQHGISRWLRNIYVDLSTLLFYSTGYHMVYSILFVDHTTTFEDIINFQPFEFIKKYEQCMNIKGLRPVISATSGDGIFDYKRMLAQLTAAAKEVQKRSA